MESSRWKWSNEKESVSSDGETNENGSRKGWGRRCGKGFGNNLSFQGYVILAFLSLNHVISITSLLVDYNIFLFAVKFSMFVLRNTQNWPFVIIKLKKAMRNFLLNSRPYLQERWWYNSLRLILVLKSFYFSSNFVESKKFFAVPS